MNGGSWTDFSYDPNGNLLDDGPNSYSWDRANRLLNMVGISYKYDGEGRRIQQKTGDIATRYLLDLQPGLAVVLREQEWDESSTPVLGDTTRFVHGRMGVHTQQDNAGDWTWMIPDGLGSVRGVVDNSANMGEVRLFEPYGQPVTGTQYDYAATPFGFTGEQTDGNGQVYLRARYYNPSIGVFPSLDPVEGMTARPMSLNGYSWVEGNVPNDAVGELLGLINGYSYANGNPVNLTDPSGMIAESPARWDVCYARQTVQRWSCVANCPNPSFYSQVGPLGLSSDLWTCRPQGCQDWLDEAHCILKYGSPGNAPTPATIEVADGLIYNSRYRSPGLDINFQGSGLDAYTILRTWITMPSAALATLNAPNHPSDQFKEWVAVLAHEYRHTVQATGITGEVAGSIRLEVEAYLIEALVRVGLGLQPDSWELELAARFSTVPIPSNTPYCDLCWARRKLRERFGDTYDGHLLIESPFPVTTRVCIDYNCPDQ